MHTAQAETAGNYTPALRERERPGEGAQAGGDTSCPGGPGGSGPVGTTRKVL